jgi:hypothetical protein
VLKQHVSQFDLLAEPHALSESTHFPELPLD